MNALTQNIKNIELRKGGKTIAKTAASLGKKVAVIEQSKEMYGGTCINVGCIPSKTLIHEGLEYSSFDQALDYSVLRVNIYTHDDDRIV